MAKASARHILVPSEAECAMLKKEIEGGASFADLAKKHSKCPSGREGGNLGEFGPVGAVQGPVKTQFGFHLIEVTKRS